jgi:hypothetical protein
MVENEVAEHTSPTDAETTVPKKAPTKKSSTKNEKPLVAAPETREKRNGSKQKKEARKKGNDAKKRAKKRTRTHRTYPAGPFMEVTKLGEAILKLAGDKIRRLTLLEKLELSPTSSTTQLLITTSGKYGITRGSYVADWLELTDLGKIACDPNSLPRAKLEAQFKLAIEGIDPFKSLYEEYAGKRLAAPEVMHDFLDSKPELGVADKAECVDIFIVNIKDLGLLRTIAAAETLIPIAQALDEVGVKPAVPILGDARTPAQPSPTDWTTICFYLTPIGDPDTPERRHSDLFKSSVIEPAMKELNLRVVRADEIENPGMIATSIIQHLRHSRLVIADLSMLNPNVFYEIALRHACKMPIVQIIQKGDKLPFDIGQVNTIIIDNTDIHSFVPKMETFRAEVAALARRALESPEAVSNPITAFYPAYWNQ